MHSCGIRLSGILRAGGKAAVPACRDDGVCLTTVTGPWVRKREELAVKRLPDLKRALKAVMEQEGIGSRHSTIDLLKKLEADENHLISPVCSESVESLGAKVRLFPDSANNS